MVLGMVEDVRVVLIRLASRTQTLRWFAKNPSPARNEYATRDARHLLAARQPPGRFAAQVGARGPVVPLPRARALQAHRADARRAPRGARAVHRATRSRPSARELEAAGVKAEITGRPKHIYSIWNKMRNKGARLLRALRRARAARDRCRRCKDCYTALGVVHNLWQPIPKEFDDYIARPKGNQYQSLHTAVIGPREQDARSADPHGGDASPRRVRRRRALALQGEGQDARSSFEQKIAWLRQLLAWRDEVADWCRARAAARLDDTVYVLTPQGKVIDLPAGATPVDFAYALHTDLGHRCRGAKVDGHIVPLDTPLASGQRVEIVTARSGGPSPRLAERRARLRRRARARARRSASGSTRRRSSKASRRAARMVEKELQPRRRDQRQPRTLAAKLGFKQPDELFAAVARDEVNLRQLHTALHGREASEERIRAPQEEATGAVRQGRRARGRHGQPAHAARPLLQAGAARSDPRLRHARQGRVGASRGLREPEAPGRGSARAPDRGEVGQGRDEAATPSRSRSRRPTGAACCAISATRSRARRSTSRPCARRAATSSPSCASASTSPTWRS